MDGLDYGILPSSYVNGTSPSEGGSFPQSITHVSANAGVTAHGPLEWDSVTFTFTNVPADFSVNSVVFQYGTALEDNHLGEPLSRPRRCCWAVVWQG